VPRDDAFDGREADAVVGRTHYAPWATVVRLSDVQLSSSSSLFRTSDPGVAIVPTPPKHTKVLGMHTNNQLGPLQLDSIKENELCVPSVTTCANCP
jgi:hypothetical protein